MIRSTAKAFPTLLRIGMSEAVAYRAEFFIWILATNMPLVMLALWRAVAKESPLGGFGPREFTAYFLAALVVRLLTGAWVVWEMNFEIRRGILSLRLLRPIHPLVHYAAENLAALPVRSLITLPIALTSLWIVGLDRLAGDPLHLAVFAVSVAGAWLLTFLAMATIGSLGFFVESSLSINEVWFGAFTLLSGYLVPLALFPPWLQSTARWLPFRYMLGFPVESLVGGLTPGALLAQLGTQWLWIGAFGAVLSFTWRAGLRRFAAYGG